MPAAIARIAATSRRLSPWSWLLPLWATLVLVYWPGLQGGFVFDDFPNIADNLQLRVTFDAGWRAWLSAAFSSPSLELQRPLAMLSFAFNHAAAGLDPFWMKLTNLGIHLLNSLLVLGLVRQLLRMAAPTGGDEARNDRIAAWVAAAWALNPINLMAVLFVVQRMESLSHTFVFAGLWLYLLGRTRLQAEGRGWGLVLAGLAGGTGIGLLAKESAVLLPLYALACEWALLGFRGQAGRSDRRLWLLYGVVLVLPGILGLAWLLPAVLHGHAYAGREFTLGERLLTEARVVVDYLHWTLLPDLGQLSLYHDDYVVSRGLLQPTATLWSLLLLAVLVLALPLLRRRRPLLALGLAWFLLAQLLTATVVPLELVYEHRNYFASLGLCVALADLCLHLPQRQSARRAGIAVAAILLLFYAGVTALRAREWSSPLRFAQSEVAKHPGSPRANYDLGRDYVLLSRYQAGSPYVPLAYAALDRAMAVPGGAPLPETAALLLASNTRHPIDPRWWASMQRKLASRPSGPQEWASMAALVDCQIRRTCVLPQPEMRACFAAALQRRRTAEMLSIYGNYMLNIERQQAVALQLWQEAAQRAPRVTQYQVSLARLYIASGEPGRARPYIDNVRRIGTLGQNEALARELERLAAQVPARRTPAP